MRGQTLTRNEARVQYPGRLTPAARFICEFQAMINSELIRIAELCNFDFSILYYIFRAYIAFSFYQFLDAQPGT